MKAKVLKKLVENGVVLQPGDVVDISAWRNAKTLITGRYIELITDLVEDAPKVKETPKEEPEAKVSKPKAVKSKGE